MTDEPENLVLRYLRSIDGRMSRMEENMRDLKHRMTAVEISVASLAAAEANHYASLSSRLDRNDDRLERIERRLQLVEPLPESNP